MDALPSTGEKPIVVEIEVSDKVMVATELAAIAKSLTVPELMGEILLDHLTKNAFLYQGKA